MNGPIDASEPGEAAVLRSPMVVATEMKTFCLNFTFNLEVCFITILSYIVKVVLFSEENHKS